MYTPSGPYIQSLGDRRCRISDCFKNGTPSTLNGASAKRCQQHIEEALISITRPTLNVRDDDPPPLCNPSPVGDAPTSRRPIQTSGGPNESAESSAEEAVLLSDQLHAKACQKEGPPPPACWPSAPSHGSVPIDLPARPSLPKLGSSRPNSRDSPPNSHPTQLPGTSLFGSIGHVVSGSSERMPLACDVPGGVDLAPLMPASARRPREGVQRDTYLFATLPSHIRR